MTITFEPADARNDHAALTELHVDDSTTLTGWAEHDGIIVSLWSDVAAGKTSGFQYFTDGSVRQLIGTISLKA